MKRWAFRIGVSLALGLCIAGHALAQTEAWNQEKATALAGELESAVSGLRDSVRKSPMWNNPQQKPTLSKISAKLKRLEAETASLNRNLTKGAGMEETNASFERIQRLKRDAQVLARKTDVSATTKPKLDQATSVLNQLAPYYPTPPAKSSPPAKLSPSAEPKS